MRAPLTSLEWIFAVWEGMERSVIPRLKWFSFRRQMGHAVMEFDFEEILRASERHVVKSQELQQRAAQLVGHAESQEGRIVVEWTGDGLSGLSIDPRAMRLGSGRLAGEIMTTAALAKADLARKEEELREEILGPDGFDPLSAIPDAAAVQSTVEQMQDMLNGTLNDTTAILDQLRKFTGSAGRRGQRPGSR